MTKPKSKAGEFVGESMDGKDDDDWTKAANMILKKKPVRKKSWLDKRRKIKAGENKPDGLKTS